MKIKKKFSNLSKEEKAAMKHRREEVERSLLGDKRKDIDSSQRLQLVDKIVYGKNVDVDKERDLLGASIIFGDVFVHDEGFHWVVVEDVHGRDFAIKYGKTKLIINPRLLILKLIDLKGATCARGLFSNIYENLQGIITGASYQRPLEDFLRVR